MPVRVVVFEKRLPLILCSMLLSSQIASAEEGMWTLNNFPSEQIAQRYGFKPTQDWLSTIQLGSVRLAQGCSGSFVSPDGLILTNHHCVSGCLQQLSSKEDNLLENGFHATNRSEERRCPAFEVNQLIDIKDVTAKVSLATQGKSGEEFQKARKATIAEIENECSQKLTTVSSTTSTTTASSSPIRCDVVTLYEGAQYELYTYLRYQDVRLAFAPELKTAFFGGDPDNFNFPRYVLDFSFLRAYKDGKPVNSVVYLPWSSEGPTEKELVFVSGHPGGTDRQLTVAQLIYQRDVLLPEYLMMLAELRGRLDQFSRKSPEHERIAKQLAFRIKNGYKALKGRREALINPSFFAQLEENERILRSAISGYGEPSEFLDQAWDNIAKAQSIAQNMRFALRHQENAMRHVKHYRIAKNLIRFAAETAKPNKERLPEYTDARLPQLKASLLSPAPIYAELETMLLEFWLDKIQRELGPDNLYTQRVLQKSSPQKLSKELISSSKLADLEYRKQLLNGGAEAINSAKDPMLELARKIDPFARKIRKKYEDEVESVIIQSSELIAKARFAYYGQNVYPDATFSLRLSVGEVVGFEHLGEMVKPFTNFDGMYQRATGEHPFVLPKSILEAKDKVNLYQSLNFVSTNDIIGGNSGSPVINISGEVVGLIFDGNIYSLGGNYGFDPELNRAVSVHTGAITEVLDKVYGAKALLTEILQKKTK